jgi:hypothetical protein
VSDDRRRRSAALRRARPARALCVVAALVLAFVVVAAALGATTTARVSRDGAARAPGAVASAGCATVDTQVAAIGPVTPYLIGAVSCAQARALLSSYFTKAANGGCQNASSRCFIRLPGGWICSFLFPAAGSPIPVVPGSCSKNAAAPGRELVAEVDMYPAGSAPGRLHIAEFLSANLRVWCQIDTHGTFATFCMTGGGKHGGGPHRAAFLDSRSGRVTTCSVAHIDLAHECAANFGSGKPALVDGQQTQAGGVRCTAMNRGVRCVRVSGAGTGNGFFVSLTAARKITP